MCKLGIVFPGQGAQYVGMGEDFYREFEEVRITFAEAREILNCDIAQLCFRGPQEVLDQTVNTQIAVLTVDIAAYGVFEKEIGIQPAVMAGHSLGEYGALIAAGVISFADALPLVYARAAYQQEAVPVGTGSMAAIMGLDEDTLARICSSIGKTTGKIIDIVNFNAPSQQVISGHTEAVTQAVIKANEKGARAIMLPISVPCHCGLLDEAAKKFEDNLKSITINDFTVDVIPNYNPEISYSKDNVRSLLAKQLNSPVRWQQTVEKMIGLGINTIVEIGPKRTLSGLIKRINSTIKTLNIEDTASLEKTIKIIKG
ncbi:MAG: ACP S-malonyltransferase [Deltaproteobacteria bacterium]|nr:ACP S-malonyltransferase [Deltaproteobacteria bacterium]